MNVLDRYIAVEVLKGSLAAALILVTLVNFFTLTDELRAIGKGSYSLMHVFQYLLLTTPGTFYKLIPSSALIGAMFTLGAMSNHRELVAMRAAGVSVGQIIGSVMIAGAVLITIAVAVGEGVAPQLEERAKVLKATAQYDRVAAWSRYGFWILDGNNFINIRRIHRQDNIGDISIYTVDEARQQMKVMRHAKQAIFQDDHWNLEKVDTTTFTAEKVIADQQSSEEWRSIVDPELLKVAVVKPGNLSIIGLVKYIGYLKDNGQKSQQFELALWGRIINPLVTLIMLLVAIPFVMNVRRTVSIGQRIITGVIIGLTFILVDKIFGHVGLVYDLPSIVAAGLPAMLFLIAALYGIKKYT